MRTVVDPNKANAFLRAQFYAFQTAPIENNDDVSVGCRQSRRSFFFISPFPLHSIQPLYFNLKQEELNEDDGS